MSTFSEFSRHADHKDENPTNGNKKKEKVNDIAGNRIDPGTGNEREDREPVGRKNLYEANSNPRLRRVSSQDRNQQTSRL